MNTLYVNNLNEKPSANTTRRELERVFGGGCTVHVRKTLALKGQAFVEFGAAVGDDAIDRYNDVEVLGRRIRVARAHEPSGKQRLVKIKIRRARPTRTLIVQNIAGGDAAQLEEFFSRYHGLERVRFIAVRRLAFVEFDSEDAAKKCVRDLRGLERFGSELDVSYAKE